MVLKCLSAAIGVFALAFPLIAMDWPAAAPVAREFGGLNYGSPLPGIVLSGSDFDVRVAGAGEAFFERGARDAKTRLPSALGDTLVIEGDDGMATLYGYLPTILDPGAHRLVAGALLGKAGKAGLLEGDGFLFALYDRKSSRWVNPRIFLPQRADQKGPVIRKVSLEAKGRYWVLGEQKVIPQGTYTMVIDSAEQSSATSSLVIGPPWYLRVLVNGEKLVGLTSEIASTGNGKLSFYPDIKGGADYLGGSGSLLLSPRTFARGKVLIEVLVRDHTGNERSAAWSLSVE